MYVFNDGKNVYEGMTKEQILAAITEAVETHEISDVDTGFVTTLKEQNKGLGLKIWVGSTAEYNAITTKETNCLYILSDDTTLADIEAVVSALSTSVNNIAILKGQVLLNTSVAYGEASADLIGTNPISDFSLVKVTANFGEVLCSVAPGTTYTLIRGTAPDNLSSTTADTFTSLVTVRLKVNNSTGKLVDNATTVTVFTVGAGGAVTAQISQSTISKIVGVC